MRGRAFTLVELLMVLLVLAILSVVAVRSVDELGVQARYESTTRSLEALDAAVVGESNLRGPDGQRQITGFVADMGRVPTSLDELWLRGALDAFGIDRTPTGDPEVRAAGGWRGPYLQLSIGADDLTDGWGRGFDTLDADGNAAGGDAIAIVRSLGQDDATGGADYDGDVYVVWEATATAVAALTGVNSEVDRIRGGVLVDSVAADDGSGGTEDPGVDRATEGQYVVIRVYGPDGAGGVGTIAEVVHDLDPGADGEAVGATTLPALSGGDLTVGPRVVRAYQLSTQPTTPDEDLSGANRLSEPMRFVNVPGGVALPRLVLE